MSDEVIDIMTFAYTGDRLCMGYQTAQSGHVRAQVWFETPETILDHVEDAFTRIYLCKDCWAAFMTDVAVGMVWPIA